MKQLGKTTGLRAVISKHRAAIIICSSVIVIIGVVGAYSWWSLASWAVVESQAQTAKVDVRRHLETAIALPFSTSDEKAKKLTALEDTQQRIDSFKEICHVPTLVEWQRAVDAFKQQQDVCRNTLAQFDTFKTSLVSITSYLRDDQVVAGLVVTAGASSGDLDEASWPGVAAKWHVLAEKTKSLEVSGQFEPVLKRITTEAEHLDVSWQEVIAAHTAKDRARYEKAKDELSKAYGTFKDAVQLSKDAIVPLQKEFQVTYDLLLEN